MYIGCRLTDGCFEPIRLGLKWRRDEQAKFNPFSSGFTMIGADLIWLFACTVCQLCLPKASCLSHARISEYTWTCFNLKLGDYITSGGVALPLVERLGNKYTTYNCTCTSWGPLSPRLGWQANNGTAQSWTAANSSNNIKANAHDVSRFL